MQTFPEIVIGGVLVAPFVLYAGLALLIFVLVRPVLVWIAIDRAFSNPPIAQLSLYVLILAVLIVFL